MSIAHFREQVYQEMIFVKPKRQNGANTVAHNTNKRKSDGMKVL